MIQDYVLGFMFDIFQQNVLLLRKTHPEWQNGKLNGVGGKLESDEGIWTGMSREFKEEVGIDTDPENWVHKLTLQGRTFRVYCLYSTGEILRAMQMEDEEPVVTKVGYLRDSNIIPNLSWIIPLCLDKEIKTPLVINYK